MAPMSRDISILSLRCFFIARCWLSQPITPRTGCDVLFGILLHTDIPPGTKPIHAGKISRGINFFRKYMPRLYLLSREYRKIFLRSNVPHISHIWAGVHVGANTCRACICTRVNTGKYSWGIIYVLVSCRGVISAMPIVRCLCEQPLNPPKKLEENRQKCFAIPSLKVSCAMKSIAAGPLRLEAEALGITDVKLNAAKERMQGRTPT